MARFSAGPAQIGLYIDLAEQSPEFLEKLRGPKGDPGQNIKGDPGKDSTAPGPKGDKGDKGDSIKGDKGDPGKPYDGPPPKDGKDGHTPTKEEIKKLIREVLAGM